LSGPADLDGAGLGRKVGSLHVARVVR
jgi:hypothetical protein